MTMNKNSTQKRVNDESFDPTVTRSISMRHSTFTRMVEKLKEEQFCSISDCAEQLILRGLNARSKN